MNNKPISFKGLRLLVVDDDRDTRKLLSILFELDGAEVLTATSAREALEIISCFQPDVLICDICLPDEDGYSLLRKVKRIDIEQGRITRAIALSAYVMDENRQYAYLAGYQKYLHKPINLDELAKAVNDLAQLQQYA
ncbi:response regulator [Calothrix sp. FACHB-1219]|uniref:response regulator n=1 Tax=unclassified Calothrix TaxID=2619626 RepID=UPI001683BBC7|nr:MULTISPECIES: response regulator [unclassified Calothrix]MBD2202471.1 response regulator [Calothrix sp. FACHB-168]MBD2217938.1 response regulator [Calothrix sp. FACHB-1219]